MAFVAILSSPALEPLEQRAFVLRAVGIEHVIDSRDDFFVLLVAEENAAAATDHLRRYEEESRPRPPPPALKLHANAWLGSIVFTLLMLGVAYCAGRSIGNFDWYRAGGLTRDAAHNWQWWRTITALTLHADVAHLAGNLLFGIPYGFFASQLLGPGRAWAGILGAAVLGNLLDSALMISGQASIGASTAVFAMLGLVAAYSWRTGASRARRWAQQWAPIVAAIALLAITGAGDERTDVLAHLAGFLAGAAIGTVHGQARKAGLERRWVQVTSGIATIGVVIAAWVAAAS
jgi:rhomboid protease GluP